ncbi:TIGR04283 family arsenosugar biosynthesis glycosyltransferase [Robertkochia aurantiaca]|uniref:TIGR04283 family arsenosugar biosynthesis glycosyltransferase n=1 Tax=Robertkochia aurantiaca TaxID=2873700 RepID=UPI001CCC0660|nr:TIGR04283 family arsenosugar biosynthesis glycosyltransferase [Robertkochia sp. 3YJGBD-33]
MKDKLSIIIPVFNEEDILRERISDLFHKADPEFTHEIILVDGGSSDNTLNVVNSLSKLNSIGFKVLKGEKGRAKQLNTGAAAAESDILYFLHIDSIPPSGFDRHIYQAVKNNAVGGCFRMRFDHDHILLRVSQWFTRINLPVCRGGDQSLFITKAAFDDLNGFDEAFKIYEDCDLINRFYQCYPFTIIPETIITSARKYRENGFWKLQYHYLVIHLKNRRRASPQQLLEYYRKNIVSPR